MVSFLVFLLTYLVLFMVFAKKMKWYDHPNGRSSHLSSTLTGFGLVFPLSFAFYFFQQNFYIPLSLYGLAIVSVVSLVDDLVFVKHTVKFIFQVFGLMLFASDLIIYQHGLAAFIAVILFGIGVINAFNFMDGVNGMLVLYSTVVLGSLLWLNQTIEFVPDELLVYSLIATCLFGFLNVRTKAICFAGDVGSISLGFIIFYFMVLLVIKSDNYSYLLLFVLFGIDSAMTVLFKILEKQIVFIPHRDFLFKMLVHRKGWNHISVALVYAGVQLLINVFVIALPSVSFFSEISMLFLVSLFLSSLYIYFRFRYYPIPEIVQD